MSRHAHNLRELIRHAEALGWTGRRTAANHIRWTHPDVPEALVTASTPGSDCIKTEKQRFTRKLAQARR
jgi:predicted RNA binding protein YcfA (HicA-like mRNA interferase family)